MIFFKMHLMLAWIGIGGWATLARPQAMQDLSLVATAWLVVLAVIAIIPVREKS